ncbi:MAG: SEC-C domain-containing protein [Candidatus Eremiobacteraeota bacterium]|nr:SEC-C domain-containing protein [Candidatus Eremiobacteraeota bacterium]
MKDYHLRCTLLDTDVEVVRHLRMPGDMTLLDLHLALQASMQWENRHLHSFEIYGEAYGDPATVEGSNDERVPLWELLVDRPDFLYRYDFGDDWQMGIEILRPYAASCHYPMLLAAAGPAPPEDCGGIPAFEALLDPDHPEHKRMLEWVGGNFDFEEPDYRAIDRALEGFFPPDDPAPTLHVYKTDRLNIKQAMVAALLEEEPLPLSELARRLSLTGVNLAAGEESLAKSWRKQKPIVKNADGALELDRDCPEFAKIVEKLESHRAPMRFLVKRFPRDEGLEIVVVMSEPGGETLNLQSGPRDEELELLFSTVDEALQENERPEALVVDDRRLVDLLREHTGLPVESRRALPLVERGMETVENLLEGIDWSFEEIEREVLNYFLLTAASFALTAPWLEIEEDQLMLIEGLTRNPILLSLWGGETEQYGLAVFTDDRSASDVLAEREEAKPEALVTFLEGAEAVHLRDEIDDLDLHTLDVDVVPYCFTEHGAGTTKDFRLMTDLMAITFEFDLEGDSEQIVTLRDGREARVSWPTSPADLADATPRLKKPGRNDPCWCGSGKKYKQCHLDLDWD